ncbi:MAG: hypothetical protein A2161_17170 [Candidatus Schekmanbacteria bacterium RBG_13_48_7]|uniref:Uncharacterized protein n=1 Tax=Candidatus Schekmanbacteria bacterium RBG_13_48_7 TaxID=1817878 RepID=A0A1F7S170_9BACT|nr:MAG: hypothetical protein A2161_17170 [Candidatus Schekmanbacteria bacterium RBG_13_48_7]
MKEQDFFNEKKEFKKTTYTCPKCGQSDAHDIQWIRREKKSSPPRGANSEDLAKFRSAQNYIIRIDDKVVCKNNRCRNRFDIPDSKSIYFI